jgi:hypothetical protein
MDGEDLYYERWWYARLRGITLRAWAELPPSIQRVWNERADPSPGVQIR